jgi:hypothetical protein
MSQFINQKGGSLLGAWLSTVVGRDITVKSFEEVSVPTAKKKQPLPDEWP